MEEHVLSPRGARWSRDEIRSLGAGGWGAQCPGACPSTEHTTVISNTHVVAFPTKRVTSLRARTSAFPSLSLTLNAWCILLKEGKTWASLCGPPRPVTSRLDSGWERECGWDTEKARGSGLAAQRHRKGRKRICWECEGFTDGKKSPAAHTPTSGREKAC